MYFDRRRDTRLDSTTVNKRLNELELLMVESWKRKEARTIRERLFGLRKPESPIK